MSDFVHEVANWAKGVLSSVEGDKIPDDALTYARDTQFVKISGHNAAIATRPGLKKATTFRLVTGVSNAKYLTSYPYAVNNSTNYSQYMVIIGDDGYLRFKEPDDSWNQVEYGLTAGLTGAPWFIPPTDLDNIDSTVFGDRLFFTAGSLRRSLRGKSVLPFGLDFPSASAKSVSFRDFTLGAPLRNVTYQLPEDVYDVFVSSYSTVTGAESNPQFYGTFNTAPLRPGEPRSLLIELNGVQSVDSWKVYVRRQSTQANAYLATNVIDTNALIVNSTGILPVTTTQVMFNATAAEIADFIIPMPNVQENSILSSEALYVATHGRRLIGAGRRKLFYSKLDQPESFPPQNFEIVDTGNGGEIVGLLPMEDELLLIFTTKGVLGLFGVDPQYWTLKPIDLNIGCVSKKSVVKFDGGVAWWSPQAGPVIMRGQQIEKIGVELLGQEIVNSVPAGLLHQIAGGWDPHHRLILWSVPCKGSVKNNCVLPYQYELGTWCASEWDMGGIPVMATGVNGNGEHRLCVADNYESVYWLDSREQFDGITPSMGTVEGTTSASAGATSLTTSGLYVFNANSTNMAGQRVTFTDASGHVIDRCTVVSNSATNLTWDRAVDLVSGGKFFISTPWWELKMKLFDGGQPFLRKRFDRLYAHVYQGDPARDIKIYYELNEQDKTKTFLTDLNANSAQTATLDVTWDVPVVVNIPVVKKRMPVFKNAHMLRFIFSQAEPGPVLLAKISVIGRVLHDRYYS